MDWQPGSASLHGTHVPRYLNAVGRWAGGGRKVPVLVWTEQDKAQGGRSDRHRKTEKACDRHDRGRHSLDDGGVNPPLQRSR